MQPRCASYCVTTLGGDNCTLCGNPMPSPRITTRPPRRERQAMAKKNAKSNEGVTPTPPKDVRQKIEAGDYKSKMEYPKKPPEPAVLRKRSGDLNSAEIENLSNLRQRYEREIGEWRRGQTNYREDDARLTAEFRADLEAENGMVGHPKAGKVWAMAWERGHSSGLNDVVIYYEELAELVKDA